MSSFKFNVLASEMRAAMLFAGDEEQGILGGVHFEVRPGKQPIIVAMDMRRLVVIETASPQENGAELPSCELTVSGAFLKPLCAMAKELQENEFPVTIEYHPSTRVLFHLPIAHTVIDAEEGAVLEGGNTPYPNWRIVIPSGDKQPVPDFSLNGEFVADFAKAAKHLDASPVLQVNLFSKEKAMEVRLAAKPNFYGIVMPSVGESVKQWQPEFLGIGLDTQPKPADTANKDDRGVPTITIDMDKKCKGCGEKGATESGLCLGCAAKALATMSK